MIGMGDKERERDREREREMWLDWGMTVDIRRDYWSTIVLSVVVSSLRGKNVGYCSGNRKEK